ncbi:peptidoglycan-associated lipoprotein Pal [Paracoccus gahaiensis]|uniref:Peptidoglycan-associated protein n=2 Tax=Paracoccus gahaiensis TaxID=1706839 RepID=A0A4U0R6Z0_9RHOB|nr:peptidoglycan-associated lipoprotein Pal [Paracoccus gahaiensis]
MNAAPTSAKTSALLAALLALAGCAQPAPPVAAPVTDPYASTGSGAVFQGDLAGGVLGAQATTQYFQSAIGDTVRFPADQTTLTAEAREILARQAGWLSQHAGFTAVVQGHAEETGTREYNLALGARRASAVQEYLVAQGVAPDRIRTLSFGKERPAATCSDEGCYAQNRRVVTVVTEAAPAAPMVVSAAPQAGGAQTGITQTAAPQAIAPQSTAPQSNAPQSATPRMGTSPTGIGM